VRQKPPTLTIPFILAEYIVVFGEYKVSEFKNQTIAEVRAMGGGALVGIAASAVEFSGVQDKATRIDNQIYVINTQISGIKTLEPGLAHEPEKVEIVAGGYIKGQIKERQNHIQALTAARPDAPGTIGFLGELFGGAVVATAIGAVAINRVRYGLYKYRHRPNSKAAAS